MANIFDYLYWRGDLKLDQIPFHEVDGVILARFSYIPFEYAGIDKEEMTISEAADRILSLPDLDDKFLDQDDIGLLHHLQNSPRFRDMKLTHYVNQIDHVSQTQFSALTIELDAGHYYVSFRGTDSTLVGWKEDFNMTFVCPVPAQTLAAAYFNHIGAQLQGDFILGGHSKGGNLAVYAASFCEEGLQDRIEKVYNFDGPGFQDKLLATEGYKRICGKAQTFVPQTSIFGMMLGHEEQYTIVHSQQHGPFQHDVYSWELEKDHFTKLETVTNSSRWIDFTLKQWISGMNSEQREQFADAVYAAVLSTNASTLKELSENWFLSAKTVLKSLKSLDEPTRTLVSQAMRSLVQYAKMGMTSAAKGETPPVSGENE